MRLIIGLGNPGEKYKNTRHNVGFETLDLLAQNLEIEKWEENNQLKSLFAKAVFNGQKIILAKPQTFMNNSGSAVKAVMDYFKIPLEQIMIVHDDIDLSLGEFKIQKSRGSAGHKGVQSVIDALDSKDFFRTRIGIKPLQTEHKIDTEEFVLQKFTEQEQEIVSKIIKDVANALLE